MYASLDVSELMAKIFAVSKTGCGSPSKYLLNPQTCDLLQFVKTKKNKVDNIFATDKRVSDVICQQTLPQITCVSILILGIICYIYIHIRGYHVRSR